LRMKFLYVFWAFCVCAVSCCGLDREAFTFTQYDLNVRIEPEQQRLAVRGNVILRNDSTSPQKHAVLQISSTLSWRSIQSQEKALQFVAQPYASDIDHTGELSEAIVTLPAEIPPKGTLALEIAYEGTIPLDTTRLTRIGTPKEVASHTDWDQINQSFTAVRGVGYVAWYPLAMESANLSEGNSVFEAIGRWKARERESDMQLEINYSPANVEGSPILLCNGKSPTRGKKENPNEFLVTKCSFEPIGATVPAFAASNYNTFAGPALRVYHLPQHASEAESYSKMAETVVPLVTDWFGAPREKAEVMELPDPGEAPFESGRLLLTPLRDDDPKFVQMTLAHELTHAAFLSPRPWIYEGLAHFAQALYRERQDGRQAALDYMGLHRAALLQAETPSAPTTVSSSSSSKAASPDPHSLQPLVTTFEEVFYRSKAVYVWWMLRDMIGDDALKKALAAYQPEQDREATYTQHLIEAHAKRDVGWFFDDWIYRDRGLPDFRVLSVYPSKTSQAGYLVTITVENLGGAGTEVPVTLHIEGGEVTKRVVVHGHATGVIRITVPSTPQEVVVNDGSVPEIDMTNNTFKITGLSK